MKNILLIISACLLFCSCHPSKTDPIGQVVLRNGILSMPIHVDVYRTIDDYNSRTNSFYSAFIPTSGYLPVPEGTFVPQTMYYYDAYTDDHIYSNWGDAYYAGIKTTAAGRPDTIIIACNWRPQLPIFIGAAAMESRWKAIDMYRDEHMSYWIFLNDTERFKQVVLRRDMTGTISRKNDQGQIEDLKITVMEPTILGDSLRGLFLTTEHADGNANKIFNTPRPPLLSNNIVTSRDTMLFQDVYGYWVMIRQ